MMLRLSSRVALYARFAMMAKPDEECMSDQDKVSAMWHEAG